MYRYPALILVSLVALYLVYAFGEKALCLNDWLHDLGSLHHTFDEIDDACTRLSFFPFSLLR